MLHIYTHMVKYVKTTRKNRSNGLCKISFIQLRFLGEIQIQGLLEIDLQEEIKQKLLRYFLQQWLCLSHFNGE